MKTVRFILPVFALLTAFSAAVAFAPPLQGNWNDNGVCRQGTITTADANGQCPGGSKTCLINGAAAYSSCVFVPGNLMTFK